MTTEQAHENGLRSYTAYCRYWEKRDGLLPLSGDGIRTRYDIAAHEAWLRSERARQNCRGLDVVAVDPLPALAREIAWAMGDGPPMRYILQHGPPLPRGASPNGDYY